MGGLGSQAGGGTRLASEQKEGGVGLGVTRYYTSNGVRRKGRQERASVCKGEG